MVAQQGSSPMEPQSPVDGSMRKRVCKACDRCRLKKSKCDGLSVCSRCRADNAICVFGERKKSHDKVYPKGYVEMLEQQQAQLVAGLQELYRRTQSGKGWEGAPLKESNHGSPLTHDILDRLGALKSGRNISEAGCFEEDLNALQRLLIANGADLMQRALSDSGSDSAHSPTFDQQPPKTHFTDPFSFNKLPPTPPSQSPPHNHSPALPSKRQRLSHPSVVPAGATDHLQQQMWPSSGAAFDENLDLLNQFDSPISLDAMPGLFNAAPMPTGTIAPYLSIRDWNHDVDFQRYFNPTAL